MQIPEELYEAHAELCKIFTSPVRLKILDMLRDGEKSVAEIANQLHTTQPNASQHLALMRKAGIIVARREGNNTYYSLRNSKILKAFDTIREMLTEQILEKHQPIIKSSRR